MEGRFEATAKRGVLLANSERLRLKALMVKHIQKLRDTPPRVATPLRPTNGNLKCLSHPGIGLSNDLAVSYDESIGSKT